ncbi:MAG: VCBS repeat-containing protein [Saprospirales bacterium]|nr:VCBS repeat-containing protein [Saprospirales bacterium]
MVLKITLTGWLISMGLYPAFGQTSFPFHPAGYTGLPISGGGCWEAVPYDLDLDDDLDILVLRAHEPDEAYLNDGAGHFTRASTKQSWQIPGGSFSAAKTDLNQDGHPDLIIGRGPASGGTAMSNGRDMLLIYQPNSNAFFEASANLPPGRLTACSLGPVTTYFSADTANYSMGTAVGDFNQDGIPDIVMANGGIIYQPVRGPIRPLATQWISCPALRNDVLKNNLYLGRPDGANAALTPDGVFDFIDASESSSIGLDSDISTDVTVADFNRDGFDDIFVANFHEEWLRNLASLPYSSGMPKLYLNDPQNPGQFHWATDHFPAETYPATSVAAADFDKDGDTDLFLTMEPQAFYNAFFTYAQAFNLQPKLFLNDGTGYFSADNSGKIPPLQSCQASLYEATFIDINLDGWQDLFCAGIQNVLLFYDPAQLRYVDRSAELLPTQKSAGQPYSFHTYGSALADFSGDGLPDIITADTYEQNRLQVQSTTGRFIDQTTTNLPPDGENNTDVAIGDLDNDGDLDIIASIFEDCRHRQSVHLQTGTANAYPLFEDRSDIFPPAGSGAADRGVEIFDLNTDGYPEVLFTGYHGQSRLYWNLGNLQFEERTATVFPGLSAFPDLNKARIDHINAQGDIVAFLPGGVVQAESATEMPRPNGFFRWDGSQFLPSGWLPADYKVTVGADFADLNADGWKDVLVVNENTAIDLFLSQNPTPGNPHYVLATPAAFVDNQAAEARFFDLEGDSDWDIVENSSCCAGAANTGKYFTLYRNEGIFQNGIPVFKRFLLGSPPQQGSFTAAWDLDADGIAGCCSTTALPCLSIDGTRKRNPLPTRQTILPT